MSNYINLIFKISQKLINEWKYLTKLKMQNSFSKNTQKTKNSLRTSQNSKNFRIESNFCLIKFNRRYILLIGDDSSLMALFKCCKNVLSLQFLKKKVCVF